MRIPLLALAVFICPVEVAHAQSLPADLRMRGVTEAQWQAVQAEVRRAAARHRSSERALAAIAERLGARFAADGRADPAQIIARIDAAAVELAELQRRLDAASGGADPLAASALLEARGAIARGDLDRASELLSQSAEAELAASRRDQATAQLRRARAVSALLDRASLAELQGDYLSAASTYASAAELTEEPRRRWLILFARARALGERDVFGDKSALREAERTIREILLPMVSQQTAPESWTLAQSLRARTLVSLSELGEPDALRHALDIQRQIAASVDQQQNPDGWASEQVNLGQVLRRVAEAGDRQAEREALSIYRGALNVRSRERTPVSWAWIQNDIGNVLRIAAARGDRAALEQAVAAYESALTIFTPEAHKNGWETAQVNLAIVLRLRGRPGDLERSIQILRAAVASRNAEMEPGPWAWAQYQLALSLHESERFGHPERRSEAREAAESAATIVDRLGIVLEDFDPRGLLNSWREQQ